MSEPERTFRDRPVSFVRRSGRMSSAQERAWRELGPRYLLELPRARAATSVAPRALLNPQAVWGRRASLIVEIGSGQGHAIVAAAARHPEMDFLGVDVFAAGLARTMMTAAAAGVDNLRLVEANAPEVLDHALPAGVAQEIWVFFPDPWQKSRHAKRRLIQPSFAGQAARTLTPGGLLRLATDWEDYARQMRRVLDASEDLARDFDGAWADRFAGREVTAFEAKGMRSGRAIRDLAYRRLGRPATPRRPPDAGPG